jgi:hypothetical protein
MFRLTNKEFSELVANCDRFKTLKHSSSPSYVFNEHGIAMLSSVLKSDKAVAINIEIIKAFIRLRHYAILQIETNEQIAELRKFLMLHIENTDNKLIEHDEAIKQIFRVLNNLIEKPKETKKIGFGT